MRAIASARLQTVEVGKNFPLEPAPELHWPFPIEASEVVTYPLARKARLANRLRRTEAGCAQSDGNPLARLLVRQAVDRTENIIGDNPEQGLTLTKTSQVRMVGNSVCPPLSRALVESNFRHEAAFMEKTA